MCGGQKYQVYAYRGVFIGMSLSTEKKMALVVLIFLWAVARFAGLGMLAALLQN